MLTGFLRSPFHCIPLLQASWTFLWISAAGSLFVWIIEEEFEPAQQHSSHWTLTISHGQSQDEQNTSLGSLDLAQCLSCYFPDTFCVLFLEIYPGLGVNWGQNLDQLKNSISRLQAHPSPGSLLEIWGMAVSGKWFFMPTSKQSGFWKAARSSFSQWEKSNYTASFLPQTDGHELEEALATSQASGLRMVSKLKDVNLINRKQPYFIF